MAGVTLAEVKPALRATTETVRRIADQHSTRPSSLNFLVSDGRVLAASRHGRDLHVAVSAGAEHVFAVASEPIGVADWKAGAGGGGGRVRRGRLTWPNLVPALSRGPRSRT